MKRLLVTMAAVSALSVAAPAAAQYAGGGIQAQMEQLQLRLQAGVRSGAISRGEAIRLREQLGQLTRLERQYGQGGFSRRELGDLQQRIQAARQALRYAERSADNRYDRNADGRDDRYDRNRDGYDDRYDRDRDGDDDRYDRNDDDRDDRYDRNRDGDDDRFDRDNDGDDDRYDRDDDDRDDRYDGAEDRYDRDLDPDGRGRDDAQEDGVGLRIGQRAPADLGALPYEYRSRYRDGNGTYYRSDGRFIYQVDGRTQAVVRIYPIDR